MGTFYSSTYKNCRCECTYSVDANGLTTTISGTIKLQHKGAAVSLDNDIYAGVSLSDTTIVHFGEYTTKTLGVKSISKHTDWTTVKSTSFMFVNIFQTTEPITKYLHIGTTILGSPYGDSYQSVTIPEMISYPIKYYVNGEQWLSGKKYFNTSYTVPNTKPSLAGYKFDRWNTQQDGSGTYYSPGDIYTTNEGLTLYAICYAVPVISSITAVRYNSSGEEDPYGDRARVTCAWSIQSETAVLSGRIIPDGGTASSFIFSSGHSGTGGTAIATISSSNGMAIDTDTQYIVEVTATNNSFGSANTVVNEILTRAYYVMDFKAGGLGVGIGRAAPDNGLEIGYETTFDEDVHFYKNGYFEGDVYSENTKLAKITDMPKIDVVSATDDTVSTISANTWTSKKTRTAITIGPGTYVMHGCANFRSKTTGTGTTDSSAGYRLVRIGYNDTYLAGSYLKEYAGSAQGAYLQTLAIRKFSTANNVVFIEVYSSTQVGFEYARLEVLKIE